MQVLIQKNLQLNKNVHVSCLRRSFIVEDSKETYHFLNGAILTTTSSCATRHKANNDKKNSHCHCSYHNIAVTISIPKYTKYLFAQVSSYGSVDFDLIATKRCFGYANLKIYILHCPLGRFKQWRF